MLYLAQLLAMCTNIYYTCYSCNIIYSVYSSFVLPFLCSRENREADDDDYDDDDDDDDDDVGGEDENEDKDGNHDSAYCPISVSVCNH